MRARFIHPAIYLITRGEATPENYLKEKAAIIDILRAAVECGVSMVQIREKRLTLRSLFALVVEAAEITRGSRTLLIVNDRADVASAAGADGVHLTSGSMPANVIRARFGPDMVIGASVHTGLEAENAAKDWADFVVFGPVYATPGKGEPAGLGELALVCRSLAPFPVIALGGIDASNYRNVIDAGSSGFGAIRYLNQVDNLRAISRELSLPRHNI
jgi:thiamine-phosphate pyrophosphorylase